MKFSEIKKIVVSHLSNLTIDDFYADPELNYAKVVFLEICELNERDDIERFLLEKFTLYIVENFKHPDGNHNIGEILKVLRDNIRNETQSNKELLNEYNSINFLLKVLLKKEMKIENVYLWKGKKSIGQFEDSQKTNEAAVKLYPIYLNKPLEEISFVDISKIQKGWKQIIGEIYNNPINNLSGIFYNNPYNNEYLQNRKIELSNVHLSALLAIKLALSTENYIVTKDSIMLSLSGGISVIMKVREKGVVIAKYHSGELEIFAKSGNDGIYEYQTLYHHFGYAKAAIQIQTPVGYYILSKGNIIDLEFTPTPILSNLSIPIIGSLNLSSIEKIDDEYQSEVEEDDRRRQEEDEENRRNNRYY